MRTPAGPEDPRTFLLPEADGPLPGTDALTASGVSVVAVPDCGHNIMLDNPEAFARVTAAALTDQEHDQDPSERRPGRSPAAACR